VDDQRDGGVLLELVENIEAAPAAPAPHGVRRIGNVLELSEDEARDQQRAGHEAGLADVGDPAVDDAAGVDDDRVAFAGGPGVVGVPSAALTLAAHKLKQLLLVGQNGRHAKIREGQACGDRQEAPEVPGQVGEWDRYEDADQQSEDGAEGRRQEVACGHVGRTTECPEERSGRQGRGERECNAERKQATRSDDDGEQIRPGSEEGGCRRQEVARDLGDGEGSDHTTHEPQHHFDACEGHGRYLTNRTYRSAEGTGQGTRGGPPFSDGAGHR
jgi:hypothetical protein